MILRRKDWMGMAVFVLMAVSAVFLAFMPMLIDDELMSLKLCCWIAGTLLVLSFICFGIQQYDSANEERVREKREAKRDKMLKTILDNQMKRPPRGGRGGARLIAMQLASELYDLSIRASEEGLPASQIRHVYEDIWGSVIPTIKPQRIGEANIVIEQFLGGPFQKRQIDSIDDVRVAADDLVRFSFENDNEQGAVLPKLRERKVGEPPV